MRVLLAAVVFTLTLGACADRHGLRSAVSHSAQVTVSSLDCDAVAWRRMSFRDANDHVIAAADSGAPLGDGTAGCTVRFVVQLPEASSYVLDNGSRRGSAFSFADLKASHFAIAIRLR